MAGDDFSGTGSNRAVHLHRRRSDNASVELVAASAFRMAAGHFLAGVRIVGALPDFIWRSEWPRIWPLQFSAAHVGALRSDDARGAREIPPGRALALGRRRGANRWNERADLIDPSQRFAMARWSN